MKKNDFFFVALDKDEVLSGVDVDDTDVITYDSKRYTDFRYLRTGLTFTLLCVQDRLVLK